MRWGTIIVIAIVAGAAWIIAHDDWPSLPQPQYRFCPQPDITSYEVALAIKIGLDATNYDTADRIVREHPGLKRHLVPRDEECPQ